LRSSEILVEGMSARELLELPPPELDALLLRPERIVFSLGTAEVLGSFRVRERVLTVELGHIDGGGEGVLRALRFMARRYATDRGLSTVEWLVHALNCPRPNPKLRRVLEERGFSVEDVPGTGRVYRLVETHKP
jgi:hypothetical protein